MAGPGVPPVVFDASYFALTLTGLMPALFNSITLPSTTLEIVEIKQYTPQGDPFIGRVINGRYTIGPLIATGGVTAGKKELEMWHELISNKGPAGQEKDGQVEVYDTSGKVCASWKLSRCLLQELSISNLQADGSGAVTFNASLDVMGVERMV